MATVRPRAAVLATVGSLGIAASAYMAWFDSRVADTVPFVRVLFGGSPTDTAVSYWQSMAAPLVIVGAIGTLGALALSRALLWLTFVLGLVTVGLWGTNEILDRGAASLAIGDFGTGAFVAVAGLLVLLVSTIALRGGSDETDPDEVSALPRGYGAGSTTTTGQQPAYVDPSVDAPTQPQRAQSSTSRPDSDDGT
ncbi:hypothetical protein [Tenggerimyces flavus]|uniref:Uncharacterized protein n=1 Tax=Tenggerimyces flavus TaxID=1708749 RepID=A0ABV7YN02_9ACTN|nr:hypothetical protein [Tenggerimyces flavus]MBM7787731.1 hypothetical protein [Tenggerimyces flavus]